MDFAAVPGLYAAIRDRAEAAAIPAAGAMGKTYTKHLRDVTLLESGSHRPVTQTPSAPGTPPAVMPGGLNGSLRESVEQGPTTGGGGIGTSSSAPHTIYASTQQWGGIHHGHPMWLWSGFIGHKPGMDKEEVKIPSRPYMTIATAETIANDSLHREAEQAFVAVVWGG